jgi:cell division cycle 14
VKCFTIDEELAYWNFFLDFGPLNLGQLFRFTVKLNNLLVDQSKNEKNHPVILFYSSTLPAKRTNAIFLICAWQVLEMKRTPEQAMFGFSYYQEHEQDDPPSFPSSSRRRRCSVPPPTPLTSIAKATVAPLPPFHDASPVVCTYELTLLHCLEGLVKARQHAFFDWDAFNVEEYEYFEHVEVRIGDTIDEWEFLVFLVSLITFLRTWQNGDLNWIIQNKIIAFAGPSYKKTVSPEGYCTLAPADYIPYFKSRNVSLVVRLNKKNYHENDFVSAGIDHLEQFYLDGSCPPMRILQRVLQAFEAVPSGKAFAVHCKAGLGRTGTCIGAYIMKHYRLTAAEVISWMRICRPGMVIGPQQQFLEDLEPIMWQEGDMLKVSRGITLPMSETKVVDDEGPRSRSTEKKRSTKPITGLDPTAGLPPLTVDAAAVEAYTGRPGQAESLLVSRRQRQAAATQTKIKTVAGPVPVTPDSVAGAQFSGSFDDGDYDSSNWLPEGGGGGRFWSPTPWDSPKRRRFNIGSSKQKGNVVHFPALFLGALTSPCCGMGSPYYCPEDD